jgi:hypothetical protein
MTAPEEAFGYFWARVEGKALWRVRVVNNRSPTGIPDSARSPPPALNLLELRGNSQPKEESGVELWRFLLSVAGILVIAFVAGILIPAFQRSMDPRVLEFLTAIPVGLEQMNDAVMVLTGLLVVLAVLLVKYDPWRKPRWSWRRAP